MNCNESRSRLHAYLDQELDLPSVVAIDQHLAGCSECRTLIAQQTALRSGIRRHAAYHEKPSALADRIRARIGSGAAEVSVAPSKPAWPWPSLGPGFPGGAG